MSNGKKRGTTTGMPDLFDSLQLKTLTLRNRWVMAPMTRCRAENGVPTTTMAEYYRRRAAGGLGMIITEGMLIDHPLANAYGDDPKALAGASEDGLAALRERVQAGEFDMAAVGRALLTEPEWVHKVRDHDFDHIQPWYAEAGKDVFP